MSTTRAAVYARVSTADQADRGYSLPSQLEACRRYAVAHGLEVVAEFSEDCSGATRMNERSQGRQLMGLVAGHKVGAVVVHDVDRLSRDIVDLLTTVQGWLGAGVEVHACDVGRIESEHNINLVIKAWQATQERLDIRRRSMSGKRTKARSGRVVGGREPYGYKHVRDGRGRVVTFEIVEPEAEIIRMIYRLYLEGHDDTGPLSGSGIAKHLSALRIPTPGETRPGYHRIRAPGMWQPDKVLKILSHELYAGVWRFGVRIGQTRNERPEEEQITVDVPAIVDRETWEAAQKRRQRNRKMSKRNRKREYLLSGLIGCACGCSMCGNYFSNHRYYTCAYRHNRHAGLEERTCRARSVRAAAIEADVWESLTAIFQDLARLELLLQRAQEDQLATTAPKQAELATVEAAIAKLEERAASIARSMVQAQGVVSAALEREAEDVNRLYELHVARRESLAAELAADRITDEAIANTVKFAADVQLGLEDIDPRTKRAILERLHLFVTVRDGRFYVASIIGSWDGKIRRLPGQRRKACHGKSLY